MLSIPIDEKILIYQGVLLEGRGIPFTIKIIENIPGVHFVIFGYGEFKSEFMKIADNSTAKDRIHFMGPFNHSELLSYTAGGDLGVSLIENISISYYYALPNKLFEYIMAGLPVISSDLPQMKNIIEKYEVGITLNPDNYDQSLQFLSAFLKDEKKLSKCAENTIPARQELNWQCEFKKLEAVL
jgi:glycosyltransferase involved in cell wall biosynthesis